LGELNLMSKEHEKDEGTFDNGMFILSDFITQHSL